jgi:biopolymer transport protein ExbB
VIEQLTELMVQSGATWVLWLLIGLSFVALLIAGERSLVFRGIGGSAAALVPALRARLRAGDSLGAEKLLGEQGSVAGRVVQAGLAEADLGAPAAESAMSAALGLERARLEKRLGFLGTVGNNAPFVGLLGTVIGVVGAFDELGRPAVMNAAALAPERVMGTIAEALVATAVGLVVAIPSVALFNHFQGRVASALQEAETLGHVLIAHLRGQYDGRGLRSEEVAAEE